jgi:glycosyltransferase involved in cell wall biosynthesis
MDGIGVKHGETPLKDNRVYNSFLKSEAVIYQSRFCEEIWQKVIGLEKSSTIILNGADEKIFSREGSKKGFGFKHMMVTAARWREWKGLDQVVETFLKLDRSDLGLVVIGANAKVPDHPRIISTGKLGHRAMAKIFRAADLFIYLPWHEWCPKVVSQALVAGLPMVCTYKGGTRELVQDCGIIVHGPKDDAVPFEPNPANLDETVQAAKTLLANPARCRPRPDLFLSTMVNQYFEFFEKVLGNR